jgi:diguanylate cyclase (GGDEF)-like protein
MRVLIVDDARANRLIITNYVQGTGHEVTCAADGQQAIEAFLRKRPDLVLLDVVMPIMDGFEAARRIRALAPEEWVPIIFLTSMVSDEDVARGIESGGDDYLAKPVSQVVLNSKMRAMARIATMRWQLVDMSLQLGEANRELQRLVHVDGLTGIANRRHFDAMLAREWRRGQRSGSPLSLLLLDVDHFKQYNDSLGHQAGDDCLRRVAASINGALRRPADLAARYGGEEFVVMLPDTPLDGAVAVAESLRGEVKQLGLPHERSSCDDVVTVSIGVAEPQICGAQTPADLVAAADRGLYEAKRQGRNRVQVARSSLALNRVAA